MSFHDTSPAPKVLWCLSFWERSWQKVNCILVINRWTICLHRQAAVKFWTELNWIPNHGSKYCFCLSLPSTSIGSKSWNAGGKNTREIREICCQTFSIKKENTASGASGETASEDERQRSRKKTLSNNNQSKVHHKSKAEPSKIWLKRLQRIWSVLWCYVAGRGW